MGAQLRLARKEGHRRRHVQRCGAARRCRGGRAVPRCAGKRIVVILPDGGERYANNPVFVELSKKVGRGT